MTDQAPELLPCPFCGSPANLRRFAVSKDEHTKISNMVSHIQCANDEGCKVIVDIQHMNEAVAIAAWNTRPPSERPVAQVREALEQAVGCLQSIAALKEDEPREPDDADWRFQALECKRCATATLASISSLSHNKVL